jgi:hypothetical protein
MLNITLFSSVLILLAIATCAHENELVMRAVAQTPASLDPTTRPLSHPSRDVHRGHIIW